MEKNILFGKRLFSLRDERHCSLEDVSKHVGITKSVLSKYERGLVEPGLGAAKKLADFFNVSVDYLCGNSDSKQNATTIKKELDELSELEKEEALRYIRYLKSKETTL